MTKYSDDIVNKICDMYATGKYTIEGICNNVGITERTFYDWKNDESKTQFFQSLKKAEEERLDKHRELALSAQYKLLNGYEFEEVTQEGIADPKDPSKIIAKSIKKVKKFVPPNPTITIFTLKNLDKKNFPDTNNHDVTTKGDKITNDIDYSKLSTETLKELEDASRPKKSTE